MSNLVWWLPGSIAKPFVAIATCLDGTDFPNHLLVKLRQSVYILIALNQFCQNFILLHDQSHIIDKTDRVARLWNVACTLCLNQEYIIRKKGECPTLYSAVQIRCGKLYVLLKLWHPQCCSWVAAVCSGAVPGGICLVNYWLDYRVISVVHCSLLI